MPCVIKSRLIEELRYDNIQEIIGITLNIDDLNLLADIKAQKSRIQLLKEYFTDCKTKDERNKAIVLSVGDGYTHQEVAQYLDTSKSNVTKVIKVVQ